MKHIFSGSELVEIGVQIEKNGRDFYNVLVGQSIEENNIDHIVTVSDVCTTDNSGTTIGIIRVVAYEEPEELCA